jgi:hypothetical protein
MEISQPRHTPQSISRRRRRHSNKGIGMDLSLPQRALLPGPAVWLATQINVCSLEAPHRAVMAGMGAKPPSSTHISNQACAPKAGDQSMDSPAFSKSAVLISSTKGSHFPQRQMNEAARREPSRFGEVRSCPSRDHPASVSTMLRAKSSRHLSALYQRGTASLRSPPSGWRCRPPRWCRCR